MWREKEKISFTLFVTFSLFYPSLFFWLESREFKSTYSPSLPLMPGSSLLINPGAHLKFLRALIQAHLSLLHITFLPFSVTFCFKLRIEERICNDEKEGEGNVQSSVSCLPSISTFLFSLASYSNFSFIPYFIKSLVFLPGYFFKKSLIKCDTWKQTRLSFEVCWWMNEK